MLSISFLFLYASLYLRPPPPRLPPPKPPPPLLPPPKLPPPLLLRLLPLPNVDDEREGVLLFCVADEREELLLFCVADERDVLLFCVAEERLLDALLLVERGGTEGVLSRVAAPLRCVTDVRVRGVCALVRPSIDILLLPPIFKRLPPMLERSPPIFERLPKTLVRDAIVVRPEALVRKRLPAAMCPRAEFH